MNRPYSTSSGGTPWQYEVFGLPRNPAPSLEVVKKAYRTLALQYHPDKNLDNKEEADTNIKIVNDAYADVKDDLEHRGSIFLKSKPDPRPAGFKNHPASFTASPESSSHTSTPVIRIRAPSVWNVPVFPFSMGSERRTGLFKGCWDDQRWDTMDFGSRESFNKKKSGEGGD